MEPHRAQADDQPHDQPHDRPHDRPDPYVARTPEDLLATVPLVLGFTPEESVVMLTFGAPRSFHARIEMPTLVEEVMPMIDSLVEPAVRHGVRRVVLLGFHPHASWTADVLRMLAGAFTHHDIDVVTCLRAHGGRWWAVGRVPELDDRGEGRPYDAVSHPFRARAVVEGRVTHEDRAAVAATLAADPGGVSGEVLAGLVEPVSVTTGRFPELLTDRCSTGGPLGDAEVAELLVGLRQGRCRSLVARHLRRDTARAQVDLWSEVVRRAPRDRVPDAAGAVALAAWVVGDGALAWCAVDRGTEVDPEHPGCLMVADLLQRAVPPERWEVSRSPLAG
ncbi:DUF4192 domain-containing protein [Nocardioides sp.]|uniref:DUF4192 domain-containing protein n=1 Tax=Nocardioides sp. TaxID=35761 RepID=UPI0035169FB8